MPPETGDNRAIQLTQPGLAALAVVRLEGPLAERFVATHFRKWHGSPRAESARRGGAVAGATAPANPSASEGEPVAADARSHGFSSAALRGKPCHLPGDRILYGHWHDDTGQAMDDVVLVRSDHSFDISLHGGVRIVARLLDQARAAGFEVIAGPPAISAAASGVVGTGDMQRWIPRASTETGLRMLLAQPAAWAALDPGRVNVPRLMADLTLSRLLIPATVAIVGPPNVGKSTLANALFGQERSIVADIPGTTRDWVGGIAELEGLPVVLVDTPGRRETVDAIEAAAIELSRAPVERADVVVHLLDATAIDPSATRAAARRAAGPLETAQPATVTAEPLTIANKCDLRPAAPDMLGISAKTGQGIPELIREVHRRLGVDLDSAHRLKEAAWFDPEHLELLREKGPRAVPEIARRLAL